MNQQEFSDMFNVYCARDKSNDMFWFTNKPNYPKIENEDEIWVDSSKNGKSGLVPPSVQTKDSPWEDSLTCPRWIPKEGEPVALYDTGSKMFVIHAFNRDNMGSHCSTEIMWKNVAKYSGQLDLRVETIRNEPHYKKDGKLCSE